MVILLSACQSTSTSNEQESLIVALNQNIERLKNDADKMEQQLKDQDQKILTLNRSLEQTHQHLTRVYEMIAKYKERELIQQHSIPQAQPQ